jgi:hypothetical protein
MGIAHFIESSMFMDEIQHRTAENNVSSPWVRYCLDEMILRPRTLEKSATRKGYPNDVGW